MSAKRPEKTWTGEEQLARPLRVRVSERVLEDLFSDNRRKRLSAESFSYCFLNNVQAVK